MGNMVCGKSHKCRVERLQVFLTVKAQLGTVASLSQAPESFRRDMGTQPIGQPWALPALTLLSPSMTT